MVRLLAYLWAAPTTAIGLMAVALGCRSGGRTQVVDGVLEAYGGFVTWLLRDATVLPGGASAMTLGHVVLGRDRDALDRSRRHERVHVAQCERWGPAFLPAYLLASFWLWIRGYDAYHDNPFEREAYDSE